MNDELPSSSFIVHRSSFIVHRSSFIVHRTSFIVHRSSFIVHRSSFIVHRSSFIVHRSSFIVHRFFALKAGAGKKYFWHTPCKVWRPLIQRIVPQALKSLRGRMRGPEGRRDLDVSPGLAAATM